jgi:hypothetical protein
MVSPESPPESVAHELAAGPDDAAHSHPKLFVSYSHESNEHRERVLGLAERLRADGFDTVIDRYVEGAPPQGWPRWMLNQIDWADYILLVCTATYYRRFRGHEAPDSGKGVDFEGAVITNELYERKSDLSRFVPIVFDAASTCYTPEPIPRSSAHVLISDEAYQKLTRQLAGASGVQSSPLGPPPSFQRKTGTPIQFQTSTPPVAPATNAIPDLSTFRAPGGTMPPDDEFYIERRADRSAQAAASKPRETIVIKGPRQFGKSSLLARYLARCRANGKLSVVVDFTRFDAAIISNYGTFLSALASHVALRLQQPHSGNEIGTQQQFLNFFESTLLPVLTAPVALAFDETDRILQQSYAEDFFLMVRMWHNDSGDPCNPWYRVSLALVTSTEPKLFIKNPLHSPFNVGETLALEPLAPAAIVELNRRYAAPLSATDCAKLHHLVGGHPFLIPDAFYKLYGPKRMPFQEFVTGASLSDGPFGEHLRAMLHNVKTSGLLAALKEMILHGTVNQEDDYLRLEGAGLVRRENGRIVPAAQIYAEFFRTAS